MSIIGFCELKRKEVINVRDGASWLRVRFGDRMRIRPGQIAWSYQDLPIFSAC